MSKPNIIIGQHSFPPEEFNDINYSDVATLGDFVLDVLNINLTFGEVRELREKLRQANCSGPYFAARNKTFRIAAISSNSNAFGLTGHVLVAKDGEAWEAARSRCGDYPEKLKVGDDITLPLENGEPVFAGNNFEIPHKLVNPPPVLVNQLWYPEESQVDVSASDDRCEFQGRVTGYRGNNIIVTDQDDNAFEVEAHEIQ